MAVMDVNLQVLEFAPVGAKNTKKKFIAKLYDVNIIRPKKEKKMNDRAKNIMIEFLVISAICIVFCVSMIIVGTILVL